MPRRNLAWLVGIASFFVLAVTIAWSTPTREDDEYYSHLRLLVDVLREVDHRYERKLTPDQKRKLIEDMINGGLEQLDPHSDYINPKQYQALNEQTQGKFGGVGIKLETRVRGQGYLRVQSPMPETPAYRQGIRANDLIVRIDGKSTENLRTSEAVDLIKGNPGEPVTLTILHEGAKDLAEAVDVRLVREEIKVASVEGDVHRPEPHEAEWDYFVDKEKKIAYLRIIQFTEKTGDEVRTVVKQLEKDGARGLVIDLRGNPGGLLQAAVEVCDLFLTDGVIVTVKGRSHEEQVYRAKAAGTLMTPAEKFPMAVLINGGSASASEITAACLQDQHRAVVVGERSYGKGSVQNIIPLEKNGALKLTTARYWRPSGKNIHRDPDSKESDEWGVLPDKGFEVPLTMEERVKYWEYRRDRDVVPGKGGKASDEKKPLLEADKALHRAVDYLRGEIDRVGAALPGERNGA